MKKGYYVIAKEFSFCYSHRVHSQSLNSEYSIDTACKCRHLHGHQGTVNVYIKADKLKDGMCTDFKHLNWFKKFIDETLDHKFIMDSSDPLLYNIFPALNFQEFGSDPADTYDVHVEGFNTVKPSLYSDADTHIQELYEGLVVVPFVPTSENLSKWLFDIVSKKMKKIGVTVSQVQFCETPKSQANYHE